MKAGHLKGALLEYIVRKLMQNCGFSNVRPDGDYIYDKGNLFFINGKGAAHDADVLMDPPVQMPFSYPSRLLFECKAYNSKASLTIVRNALGLRNDINDFEIVTDETLRERRNNLRGEYSVKNRKRHFYQVGVASLKGFTKPAVEFAVNNKIPLISLDLFFGPATLQLFEEITENYVQRLGDAKAKRIYDLLKNKTSNTRNLMDQLDGDLIIGEILYYFNTIVRRFHIGLIETGDMIFLFPNELDSLERLQNYGGADSIKAQIHWYTDKPDIWVLKLFTPRYLNESADFKFYLPEALLKEWKKDSYDKIEAINMKAQFFRRIFIFNNRGENNFNQPFFIVTIDDEKLEEWRQRARAND